MKKEKKIRFTVKESKAVITKWDNDGTIYFSYTTNDGKTTNLKPASVKYFCTGFDTENNPVSFEDERDASLFDTVSDITGFAVLDGLVKDSVVLLYASDKTIQSEDGKTDRQLYVSIKPNYNLLKDSLVDFHTDITDATEVIIKNTLKSYLKDNRMTVRQFFKSCHNGRARFIGDTKINKDNTMSVSSIPDSKIYAINSIDTDDDRFLFSVSEMMSYLEVSKATVKKHNDRIKNETEKRNLEIVNKALSIVNHDKAINQPVPIKETEETA